MPLGVSLHIGLNSVDPGHYQGWSGPLVACEADARDMSAIAAGSGFKPEIVLTRSATRAVVEERIAAAAGSCAAGDIFLLTYSGHGGQVPDLNGDEADGRDETWCLFDGQLIDDEIYHALSAFSPGVRILVLSDSCHSGSITKNLAVMESLKGESTSDSYRAMPTDLCFAVYEAHKAFYQPILLDPTLVDARSTIKASALLISGCQDNQLSRDGPFNGAFTGALKRVWNGGKFQGDYSDFHQSIQRQLPIDQSPNFYWADKADLHFQAQRPFTVEVASNGAAIPAAGPKEASMSDCLVTVQIKGLDLTNEANLWTFCQSLVPAMVQEIKTASSSKGAKGCSVSGSVSTGPHGTSGTGTVTCTL
jgi:hypothetical protein